MKSGKNCNNISKMRFGEWWWKGNTRLWDSVTRAHDCRKCIFLLPATCSASPRVGEPRPRTHHPLDFFTQPPSPQSKLDHFHWLEKIGWSSFSYGRPSIEVSCLCGHFHTPFAPRSFYGWFFISWLYSEFIPSDSDSEYLIYFLESDKTFFIILHLSLWSLRATFD